MALLKCNDMILTARPSDSTPSLLRKIVALYDLFETIIDFDFELFLLGATEPWIRLQPRKSRVSRGHLGLHVGISRGPRLRLSLS